MKSIACRSDRLRASDSAGLETRAGAAAIIGRSTLPSALSIRSQGASDSGGVEVRCDLLGYPPRRFRIASQRFLQGTLRIPGSRDHWCTEAMKSCQLEPGDR